MFDPGWRERTTLARTFAVRAGIAFTATAGLVIGGVPRVVDAHLGPAASTDLVRTLVLSAVGLLAMLWTLLLPLVHTAGVRQHARARTDELTGLANRTGLEEQLGHALQRLERSTEPLAVLFLGVDGFQAINNRFGHAAGDQLLRRIGESLARQVRTPDLVARFAGDEFVIVLEQTDARLARLVAERLQRTLRELGEQQGVGRLRASIGVNLVRDHTATPASVIREADAAMEHVKLLGGGDQRMIDDELRADFTRRSWVEQDLPSAARLGELALHFQPFVAMHGPDRGRAVALEALVRWSHPTHGPVSPALFVPVAEDNGEIEHLGAWVVEEACRQLAVWQRAGTAPDRLFVNLSARQLGPRLIVALDHHISEFGTDPTRLGFEVTETAIGDDEAMVAVLEALRERGCAVALDDFGTGYSSLSRLRELPLDLLKLDAEFVRQLGAGDRDRAVLHAVASLTRDLGISVLAEGVETPEELAAVADLGIDLGQGWLMSRDVTAELVPSLLRRNLITVDVDIDIAALVDAAR